MTDFNDGKWHGWNGGECPVHPLTHVEIATSGKGGGSNEDLAQNFKWSGPDWRGNPIVAFRVTKKHREPREWVICESPHHPRQLVFDTPEDARAAGWVAGHDKMTRVREVIE